MRVTNRQRQKVIHICETVVQTDRLLHVKRLYAIFLSEGRTTVATPIHNRCHLVLACQHESEG